jgi:hypothetical protein
MKNSVRFGVPPLGGYLLNRGSAIPRQEVEMTKKNLHFWISVAGGMLVPIFAQQTRFFLSYVLRIPGMILREYIPISGFINIGYGALKISILQVTFYTFLIYSSIRLMSLIINSIHNARSSVKASKSEISTRGFKSESAETDRKERPCFPLTKATEQHLNDNEIRHSEIHIDSHGKREKSGLMTHTI